MGGLQSHWHQLFKSLRPLWPGTVTAVFMLALLRLGVWESLENLTYHFLFKMRGEQAWDDRIVLITLDEASADHYGPFPWSRDLYTQLIQTLDVVQPSAIGFDLIWSEPTAEDDALGEALMLNGSVALALAADGKGEPIASVPILDSTTFPGHVDKNVDLDGVTRYVYPYLGNVPTLGLSLESIHRQSLGAMISPNVSLVDPGPLADSPLFSPAAAPDRFWVNWPGSARHLAQHSLWNVLEGQVPLEVFRNKIVLVGATLTGQDPLSTAFDVNPPTFGVYLHAAVVHNLLRNNFLHRPLDSWIGLLIVLGGPGLSFWLHTCSLRRQRWLAGSLCLGWAGLGVLLFYGNVWIPIINPIFLMGLTSGLVLFKTQVQATATLKARSEFLAMMSHELRTPINGVIGMTGMLLETPLTADQSHYANVIRSSGETILALVNDILDFSKIEAGHLEVEDHPFNLRECIEDCLDLVVIKAREKNVEMAYAVAPEVPEIIRGDITRIRQILLNLLSNAVKFTATGDVLVWVRCLDRAIAGGDGQATPGPGSAQESPLMLEFAVADSGIGIPPQGIQRLFKPFMQVDVSTSRKYGGTGLGLVISQRLSVLMGGTLWVVSRDGEGSVSQGGTPPRDDLAPQRDYQGSTFYFTLRTQGVASPEPSLPSPLAGQCALVLESQQRHYQLLEQQLASWGMTTEWARSQEEMVQQITSTLNTITVALINADTFPELPSVLQNLRAYMGTRAFPIIFLASLDRSQRVVRIGFSSLLTKPIRHDQMHDMLIKVLVPAVAADAALSPAVSEPHHQSFSQKFPLRILMAEDNPVNQTVGLHLLKRLGYRADTANNGQEVLDSLQRQWYDVILMDVHMPEVDGLMATRQIYQRWKQPPRIVAMTASDYGKDRRDCEDAGMVDHLCKPFRVDDLKRVLRRCAAQKTVSIEDQTPASRS